MAGMQKYSPALQVLKAVHSSVRSLLGPRKMIKCSFGADPNEEQLFNDTMLLLRKLVVEHPVYDLLFDLCHAHHEVWGCGTTTLVVLSVLWTEEASRLVDQGVPLPCIVFWFRKSIETFKTLSSSNAFTVSNIFEHFEANNDPTLEQLLMASVTPIADIATKGQKPPPSIQAPSSTATSCIPFQLGRSSSPVLVSLPTRELSGVNRYSRYALPSATKERAPGTAVSPSYPASHTPVVNVTGGLAVGSSFERFPATVVTMATVSHGNSFAGVLPNTPATNRLGNFLRRAHPTTPAGGHTMSVNPTPTNCPDPTNCFTPANCPAPTSSPAPTNCPALVGDQPCTKCRHSSALEYLVSAVCPSQHWKARDIVVQCMMLQCCGGKGARGHGKFDRSCILSEKVTGPPEELSIVLPGIMVVRISSDFVPLVQELHECSPLRLLTLSGDLVPGYLHKGMKVTQSVKEVTSLGRCGVGGEADQWLQEVLAVLNKLSVKLLAIKGFASHDVIMACLSHDIIVVEQVAMEKLVHLSEASGSEILSYVQHADKVPRKELQVLLCAHTPELVSMLECDFHKCLVRIEAVFSDAALVPGGGWIEAACVRALEKEVRKRREMGSWNCQWSSVHGPSWMGPLCYEYREVVLQGVIGGLRSFLTTLAHNLCVEGNGGVEGVYLSEVAEQSDCLPGVLDLRKVKDEVWAKAVDFMCLTNRGM